MFVDIRLAFNPQEPLLCLPREFQGTDLSKQDHVKHGARLLTCMHTHLHPLLLHQVRLANQLGPLVRTTKLELMGQFKDLQKTIDERLEVIGRKPITDDWEQMEKRLEPLKTLLRNVGKKLVKEDLTDPYEIFVGDLRELGGDDLNEVDIDFWELNAFEVPLFQGEDACRKLVRLKMEKWIPPFEKLRDSVYEIVTSKMDLLMDSSACADLPPELIELVKSRWVATADKMVSHLTQHYLPKQVEEQRDGRSAIEEMGR